ncbi:hypothetical protein ScPMuIL_009761 [Solemya velum]
MMISVAEEDQNLNVVMTGGSFTTSEPSTPVMSQPRPVSHCESVNKAPTAFRLPFDDAHSERDWNAGLCKCCSKNSNRNSCSMMCWCYHKYTLAARLGETPFMSLIPCATFALRVKVRTLFGIKGSILKDFSTALCCEPCAVCQMTRELDEIGL